MLILIPFERIRPLASARVKKNWKINLNHVNETSSTRSEVLQIRLGHKIGSLLPLNVNSNCLSSLFLCIYSRFQHPTEVVAMHFLTIQRPPQRHPPRPHYSYILLIYSKCFTPALLAGIWEFDLEVEVRRCLPIVMGSKSVEAELAEQCFFDREQWKTASWIRHLSRETRPCIGTLLHPTTHMHLGGLVLKGSMIPP